MFKLKVGQPEVYEDIEQRETRLRMPFQILTEIGEVAAEMNESFPLGTDEAEIRETLQRHLSVFTEDFERYEDLKIKQEQRNQAEQLAAGLKDVTIQ